MSTASAQPVRSARSLSGRTYLWGRYPPESRILNLAPMVAALTAGGIKAHKVITFAKTNHLFQKAKTGSTREYTTLAPEFVSEFLPALEQWIQTVGGAK